MSTPVIAYVTAHAAGIGAILLAVAHLIMRAPLTTVAQDLAIAAAAWGLNLKPVLQQRLRNTRR